MFEFEPDSLVRSVYRPFQKQNLYFSKDMNEMVLKMPRIFPKSGANNRAIMVKGNWRGDGHFATMIDSVPCLQPDGGAQCFPMKLYRVIEDGADDDLFGNNASVGAVQEGDAITETGLKHFQDAYPGETITKEDLFYYVYGLLHSEDYRAKYADNLSKELPRIPRVKTAADFWAFSRAGRTLGDLHVNYETVEPYPVTIKQGDLRLADIKNPEAFYRVTKWAFGKSGKDKDKTTVIYNPNITMQDVPLAAYDYVVNGKPALEWVMERQVVKTDKASGIENDANRYANETMNNPAYPLDLFQRVITVSLRTMEIVRGLPKLEVM
jgi:predicted helicase